MPQCYSNDDFPLKSVNESSDSEESLHWKGMPEFIQEEQNPYSKIIFRFNSEEDLQEFSKLIGQKLTNKTKSAWYPELERGKNAKKRWKTVDL